jgi:hypothetical protein
VTGSPAGFWSATPRILALAVDGALERARSEQQRAAWAAWTTAALGRVDKMPSLEKVIGTDKPVKPPEAQTWEQQLSGWERFLK